MKPWIKARFLKFEFRDWETLHFDLLPTTFPFFCDANLSFQITSIPGVRSGVSNDPNICMLRLKSFVNPQLCPVLRQICFLYMEKSKTRIYKINKHDILYLNNLFTISRSFNIAKFLVLRIHYENHSTLQNLKLIKKLCLFMWIKYTYCFE